MMMNLPDPDELINKYFVSSNTNKNIPLSNITVNDMSQNSFLKQEDRIKVLFYDSIRYNDVEFESGDYCSIKPGNMKSDPYVLDQSWMRTKLSSESVTEEMQQQRDNLESLFAQCSEDVSTGNNLQEYLERALCNKTQKKIKENREMVKRIYKETLPKIISSHMTSLLYTRVKINHHQTIHEKYLHPQFEYKKSLSSKMNEHPFYGLPAKINSDKSRFEEYLAFLVLNPLHDYKATYRTIPRNFLISQYVRPIDIQLIDKSGVHMTETYNSYLYKLVVLGIIDPSNHNNMTRMRDLIKYKIPFNESKYPNLTNLVHMNLYASYLSVLTEKSLIDFQIYKTNSLDDVLLYSKSSSGIYFYNMKKNIIIYDHINNYWYYQMNGTNCYKTDDFFTMFDDLLELLQ